jgi:hypothetical protein
MIVQQDIKQYPQLLWLRQFLPYGETGDVFIAGGCFKNIFNRQPCKDIDIFFKEERCVQGMINHFEAGKFSKECKKIYESSNAIGFKWKDYKIDLVKSRFGEAKELIEWFDFTICKFAMDRDDVYFEARFWADLHLQRLVIDDKIVKPLSTLERTWKYAKYGYMLCRESKRVLAHAIINEAPPLDQISKEFYNGFD